MSYLETNFADGLGVAHYLTAWAEGKPKPLKPEPGSTSGNVFAKIFYSIGENQRPVGVGTTLVLQPDTTFEWPGGSYDKGETPKGTVYGITVYDADGNVMLLANDVMVTVAQLNRAKNGTALEKLLLRGDDLINVYQNDGPIRAWNGGDTLTFYQEDVNGSGGAGNDVLSAKNYTDAGLSRLSGDAGADTLNGSDAVVENGVAGRDQLMGGAGDDFLFGNGGIDILTGGTGDDELAGGFGADAFVFGTGDGNDTVKDFTNGADQLDLSDWDSFATFNEVSAHAVDANGDLLISHGADSIRLVGFSKAQLDAADVIL